MVYYKMADYKLIGFRKARSLKKKYEAILKRKSDGRLIYVAFGSPSYAHFQDKTGLNLYKNHGDKKRKDRYIARHKHNIKSGYYSPSQFAMDYLWT